MHSSRLTTTRFTQILFLIAKFGVFLQAHMRRFQRGQRGQRLPTGVAEFVGNHFLWLANGFVHIAIGDGLWWTWIEWRWGCMHQWATIFGTTQQTHTHCEAFDLKIIETQNAVKLLNIIATFNYLLSRYCNWCLINWKYGLVQYCRVLVFPKLLILIILYEL